MSTDAQFNQLSKNIQAAMEKNVNFVFAKLEQGTEKILDDSNAITPKLTGHLISTGGTVSDKSNKVCGVEYTADYALDVHEDLSRSHPHGQAKFLETAFVTDVQDILKDLGAELK